MKLELKEKFLSKNVKKTLNKHDKLSKFSWGMLQRKEPEKIFNADLKSVDLGLSDILIFEKGIEILTHILKQGYVYLMIKKTVNLENVSGKNLAVS